MKKHKKNLQYKINGALTTQIVYTAVKQGLFDSNLEGAHPKLLRALAGLELVEHKDGSWQITEEGSYLSSTHSESLRDLILYKGAPFNWAAYGKLSEALENGSSAFEAAFGCDLFEYLEKNPEQMEVFQRGMAYFERSSSTALLDELDLSAYNSVCDLGCGTGGFLKRLLRRCPHLKGLGVDLPSVVNLAEPDLPLQGGDFFKQVPEGYDLYLLRSILHDWSDKACIDLMNRIPRPAHVLVIEALVPEDPMRRLAAFSDLHLMATTAGGQERTLKNYQLLFKKAHFQVVEVISSSSAKSAIKLISTI
jgi:SAM-dependent methyltransferase